MANYTVTSTLAEPNNRRFSVRGTSATSMANARAEHNAKLALTVGTLISQLETTAPASADGAVHAAGSYSDAVVIVRRDLGGGSFGPKKSINLQNIANAYALSGGDGQLDITNADIAAFVAAYEDSDGNKDYVAIEGFYVA